MGKISILLCAIVRSLAKKVERFAEPFNLANRDTVEVNRTELPFECLQHAGPGNGDNAFDFHDLLLCR